MRLVWRADRAAICELVLLLEGFEEARALAVKCAAFYDTAPGLCRYADPDVSLDIWGFRGLMVFVSKLGDIRRSSPNTAEPKLVMKAVEALHASQLAEGDALAFSEYTKDLFAVRFAGKKTVTEDDEEALAQEEEAERKGAYNQATEDCSLWPHDELTNYAMALDELMIMRRGIVVVGRPGSAKSTIVKVTHAAKVNLDPETKVKMVHVCPNALAGDDLLGSVPAADRRTATYQYEQHATTHELDSCTTDEHWLHRGT